MYSYSEATEVWNPSSENHACDFRCEKVGSWDFGLAAGFHA